MVLSDMGFTVNVEGVLCWRGLGCFRRIRLVESRSYVLVCSCLIFFILIILTHFFFFQVASTKMNEDSSRSHSVCMVSPENMTRFPREKK